MTLYYLNERMLRGQAPSLKSSSILERGEQIFVFQVVFSCFILSHIWKFTKFRTKNKKLKGFISDNQKQQPAFAVQGK
jgi:hypothetical protein